MHLDSYTCDLCILQKQESLRHLFFRYSFAKNYWQRVGVLVPTWLKSDRATRHIRRSLSKPYAMKIIILMCWSIWRERNAWIFEQEAPSVERCLSTFKREMSLVPVKTNKAFAPDILSWLQSIS
jgi:hypothetical protein